ncbi:hypothetical protein BDF22DRAFT_746510 [Syncephalis plumigaleata]|nr:hypothetical protein BDF22DRAFT_746510 [Syncephalis plumigaleata]
MHKRHVLDDNRNYSPPRDFGEYMVAKRRKLAEQQHGELAALTKGTAIQCISNIFNGISVFATGYMEPSAVKLRELICLHGGRYEQYYHRSRVTHIIATTLTTAKFKQWRQPTWIIDSIEQGRLLTWTHYRLHNEKEYTDERAFWQQACLTSHDTKDNSVDHQLNGRSTDRVINDACQLNSDDMFAELSDTDLINYLDTTSTSEQQSTETVIQPVNDQQQLLEDSLAHESTEHTSTTAKKSIPTSATDENFVANYYASSRLHHLSRWKAELRNICANLELNYHGKVDVHQCIIMHIDMDCFFTSVATRNRPELAGYPVGISHSTGTGSSSDLASCNYEARKYGLKNGIRVGDALKKCPHLILLPYEFNQYQLVSTKLYKIFAEYAAQIQAVSCDEALLGFPLDRFSPGDVVKNALSMAGEIRAKIYDATKCTASVGVSRNILLAKLATQKAKPNGHYYLHPEEAHALLDSLPVKSLPGVGWSLGKRLKEKHIETGSDLRKIKQDTLQQWFGVSTGRMLYKFVRGIDERPLQTATHRQSISTNVSWGVRFEHVDQVEKFIDDLAREVARRTAKENAAGRMIVLKLYKRKQDAIDHAYKVFGHGQCDILHQSHVLSSATREASTIKEISWKLFIQMDVPIEDIRGVGIQLLRLTHNAERKPSNPTEYKIDNDAIGSSPPLDMSFVNNQEAIVDCNDDDSTSSCHSSQDVNSKHDNKAACQPALTTLTQVWENYDANIPPTYVDPDVFKALPSDIQHELAINRQRQKREMDRFHRRFNHSRHDCHNQNVTASEMSCQTRKSSVIVVGKNSRPMLDGLTDWSSVRHRIGELLKSNEKQMDEFTTRIQRYLLELVQAKNLERVRMVLLYIERYQRRNQVWSTSYNAVYSFICQKVSQQYRMILKL